MSQNKYTVFQLIEKNIVELLYAVYLYILIYAYIY